MNNIQNPHHSSMPAETGRHPALLSLATNSPNMLRTAMTACMLGGLVPIALTTSADAQTDFNNASPTQQ